MNKYSHKRYPSMRRGRDSSRKGRWVMLVVFILLVAMAGMFFFRSAGGYFSKVSGVVGGLSGDRLLAAARMEEAPPVHFEFYTELPNAKINNSHPLAENTPRHSLSRMPIASHDELEREFSEIVNQKRPTP